MHLLTLSHDTFVAATGNAFYSYPNRLTNVLYSSFILEYVHHAL